MPCHPERQRKKLCVACVAEKCRYEGKVVSELMNISEEDDFRATVTGKIIRNRRNAFSSRMVTFNMENPFIV